MQEILFNIFIFLIFLGPLIFFHELGHFLFAKWAGVRVETFSIGFGPKLFKFQFKGTCFAFSLIPLGGYVKMFGEDLLKKDGIPEEERQFAYNHKSIFKRFWIVFGGPLANFIFAFFIYFGLLKFGESLPAMKLGAISEESKLYSEGFRSGDHLKKINEEEIFNLEDIALFSDKIEHISVSRRDKIVSIPISLTTENLIQEFVQSLGRLQKPTFVDKDLNRWILSEKETVNELMSLEEIKLYEGDQLYLFNEKNLEDKKIVKKENFINELRSIGMYPEDLKIEKVLKDTPAQLIGIQEGDIILAINDQKMQKFDDLRTYVQKNKEEKAKFKILRSGEEKIFELSPVKKVYQNQEFYSVGIQSGVKFIPSRLIDYPAKSIIDSTIIGAKRTYRDILRTFNGFKKLIFAEVSMDSIGGPVAIAKVASNSFQISLSYFFRLMALISINLGLINLFPIPVLDGGHIVFLFLEFVNRGPLSRRKLELAQQFGFSLLMLLIVLALYNDINRFF
jgi:regulator of sigma E protease